MEVVIYSIEARKKIESVFSELQESAEFFDLINKSSPDGNSNML